jgi:hypothetical protein
LLQCSYPVCSLWSVIQWWVKLKSSTSDSVILTVICSLLSLLFQISLNAKCFQSHFIVLSDINECQMFSNLCVYGRCVNIFGMFRCECDEGYALDGSGGEFINSLEFLKCSIIQYYNLWSCTLVIQVFHVIVQNTHTHTRIM